MAVVWYSEEEEAEELEARIRTISWLPLPLLMLFTIAFNVGMGSLTWVVATEVRQWAHAQQKIKVVVTEVRHVCATKE